jgi:alpha-methylacyl-CoA racemase
MGPLNGLKVVEMTGLAPAPYCGMMLADAGADVLRIDRPGASARQPHPERDVLMRSRPSLEIDLKSADGRSLVKRLIDQADALIEGFRPGVMERMGLGPDVFQQSNPKLVYGRVTGWGQDGPIAQAAGHDVNYIALSGALNHVGPPDAPPVVPLNLIGDFAGGGLLLAYGIMCAVFEAGRSGEGQVVDAAMLDGAASLMSYMFGLRAQGALGARRGESVLNGYSPFYGVYEAKDGLYVTLAAAEPQFYAEFLRRTGQDSSQLPDQNDREAWPQMRQQFAAMFRTKTRSEWCDLLEGTDACFAPVLSLDEVAQHPQNRHRNTFVEVGGVLQPAPAPRFSRTPAEAPAAPQGFPDDETRKRWGLDAVAPSAA